jgi:GNAT superfamily N-acetyltransferase
MIDIRTVQFSDIAEHPDFQVLLDEYGEESSINGMPPPDCQVHMYQQMQDLGIIHVFAAYEGEALAGILCIITTVIPHYGAKVSTTESFFVRPSHRKAGAGLMLLRAAEKRSDELGAVGLLVSAPFGGQLAEVLSKKGYSETNRVFFRKAA